MDVGISPESLLDLLDAQYIERLGDDIHHAIKTLPKPRVVIDLKSVRLLSSSALGMLMALQKVIAKQGGSRCVSNVSEDVMKVFRLTQLHKRIGVYDRTDRAVASLV